MTDNRTTERVDHSPRVREAIDELMREKDAADNRTTELREKLDSLSIEHFDFDKGGRTQTMWEAPDGTRHFTYETSDNPAKTARLVIAWFPTPEQAIAATLGSDRHPYEQRITGDGSDWGEIMRDAYDDLMANACESCTPEQIEKLADYIRAELGIGTLTAEQVREAIRKYAEDDSCYIFEVYGEMCGPIADELNAELGSGTCKITATATNNLMYPDYMTKWYELSCGHSLTLKGDEAPKWCAVCGKAVKR